MQPRSALNRLSAGFLRVSAPNSFGDILRRAELDGVVAHLYGLTEDEFSHIPGAFPLVDESVKVAALEAYQVME